jgi:two-component system CheB/CheR fusion protein
MLFNTILISVTGFFRDPEAWEYLRQKCVADLVGRRPDLPMRVLVMEGHWNGGPE